MRAPEEPNFCVLIPYDPREGTSLKEAAARAGKSDSTLRNWCEQHGLGRRVGGSVWVVSKPALEMFLDGDLAALAAYHQGDRDSPLVAPYFTRVTRIVRYTTMKK
nr:helix-turn-helix domain-containing protein [Bradyrhizobium sp. JYMT SZCCT0428]